VADFLQLGFRIKIGERRPLLYSYLLQRNSTRNWKSSSVLNYVRHHH